MLNGTYKFANTPAGPINVMAGDVIIATVPKGGAGYDVVYAITEAIARAGGTLYATDGACLVGNVHDLTLA